MLNNKISVPRTKQAGFSLVELMIAIAIGLVITAAVTAMAVNSLKMNSQTLKSARLNQDMGAVMQIMVNDIRRAGYTRCVDDPDISFVCPSLDEYPYRENLVYHHLYDSVKDLDVVEDINIVSPTCVLYSYNRNGDNMKDNNERQGFKLENNQVKMRISCGTDDSYDTPATSCATDCSEGIWVEMTDPEVITITKFKIDSGNSKCRNIDNSIRIIPGASATEFACNEPEKNSKNVQKWTIDIGGKGSWTTIPDPKILPLYKSSAPTLNVGVRHVNISLEAELAKDSSVSKNLDVSIKVRNDHIYN